MATALKLANARRLQWFDQARQIGKHPAGADTNVGCKTVAGHTGRLAAGSQAHSMFKPLRITQQPETDTFGDSDALGLTKTEMPPPPSRRRRGLG